MVGTKCCRHPNILPIATLLSHGIPTAQAPREFTYLVRFNRVDWLDARRQILTECGVFETPDVSDTGKWALVNLLQATGGAEEASRANMLVAKLTSDRPVIPGWRLVENYCATDPCDPDSNRPDNISATAKEYATIDVSKISLSRIRSEEGRFFSMASPGLVRFEPQVAINKHREFISDVLGREGFTLRQGLFEICLDNPLLTRTDALRLVRPFGSAIKKQDDETLSKDERWIVSQFRALLAFPQLSAQEQITTLLAQAPGDDIILQLSDVMKPVDETTFEALLEKACDENNDCGQFRILVFGANTDTAISDNSRRRIAALVRSNSDRVRAQALALITRLGDKWLINAVVQSDWSAVNLGPDDTHEAWYGSAVMSEAASHGLIRGDVALDRMASLFYGHAAKKLPAEAVRNMAQRIDASIRTVAGLTTDRAVPEIEIQVPREDDPKPALYSAQERASDSDDPVESFNRFSESNEAFEERQRRVHAAFEAFRAELTHEKAEIILDRFHIDEFDAIAASDQGLAENWDDLFVKLPKTKLMAVHHLGHFLAHALSAWSPDKAARLFTVLGNCRPLIRVTFGRAGLTLDRMALWSAADHPTLEVLCFQRLDRTGNDHELSLEVLAALWNGKEALLRTYITDGLATGEPAKISRALMVAGLSEQNPFNHEILAGHKDKSGFIGTAYEAAMYAYERNIWAEHWFRKMCETTKPDDFWRYSILFTKIVDGRFEVWKQSDVGCGEPFQLFWPRVESKLEHRFKKWRRQRERKLFGDDAPAIAFLH